MPSHTLRESTPPTSSTYNHSGYSSTQQQAEDVLSSQPRCIPLAPEQRLGIHLDGTLQLTEILGTGAYGVVYSALDMVTGIRYAVKCLSKFNADGTPLERRQIDYQQREIRLHYMASAHPNIVSLLKIIDDADCIFVVLEYCPEGDLFMNITELGHYVGRDELSRQVFLQIVDAVEHCHSLSIYHRDLKPENILVSDGGNTVKLADFGLATSHDRSSDYGCGSTFYMSPECLDTSANNSYYMCAPNDVWSLGVILVNLTCGRNPWKQASFQDATYRAFIRSPAFLMTILPLTDELNEILARIFNPNPDLRITLADLRRRILECPQFTVSASPTVYLQPQTPDVEQFPEYVTDDNVVVDGYQYDAPRPPARTSSDPGSLTSSGSTISGLDGLDDEDDEYIQAQQDVSLAFHADGLVGHGMLHDPGMVAIPSSLPPSPYGDSATMLPNPIQLHSPSAVCHQQPSVVQTPAPGQVDCSSKPFFPLWDMFRYVQQVPMVQHPVTFQQVPFMPSFQGCY
ncbi:hypothetical protein E4U13_003124 [Claviceps humidiphila]|uniref:Autophagy-related protein 1 n=1 Tax=Claviceps humidiphila TaxID=1294629 RepID=A0A9P7TWQ9_9HYPO|nr:hypothetical protein E4U13_003124 [Claviceps humidiphila]